MKKGVNFPRTRNSGRERKKTFIMKQNEDVKKKKKTLARKKLIKIFSQDCKLEG